MRNILNILLVSFWVVFLCNCSSMSEQQFTTELRNRSLEDAAKYYCEMRPKLKFADSVFSNEIIPQLDSCKFSLLQNMRTIVENTPVYSRINTIYTNRWTSIVDSAEQTLWDYSDQQMSLLINELIPQVFSELRNRKQVNKDMANVIKEYKGWFGKIFDSEEDFKEEWDELITSKKCQKWIDTLEFYTKYKDNIRATYQKYYEDNCPQQFRLVAIPDSISVDLTMPHDIVAAWISGEQDKSISIAKDFAMDFAESVLESAVDRMVSGGRRGGKSRGKNKSYSTPKKKGLDIDVEGIISGFADGVEAGLQNLKDDEKLAYVLSENMINRIPYYIVIDYIKYFINQNNGILSQMKDNYQPGERSASYSEFLAGIMNDSNDTQQNTASSSSSSTSANASSASSSTSLTNTSTSTNTTPAKSSAATTDKNNNTNSTLSGKYPFASQRLLTTNELKAYTANELRIMRNEIFARHGYIFIKGGEMDTYFRKQSWYKPKYSNVNSLMSKIETQNIQTIKQVEATKK